MTDNERRSKITAQARSWLGLSEPVSYAPILRCWNAYAKANGLYVMTTAEPWCAMFVSAVFIACGLAELTPMEVSCGRMLYEAEKRGLWVEDDAYLPRPGDLILYDWQDSGSGDNSGEPDHVGLVVGVSGEAISVIEGNCADAVREVRRTRGQRYIRGYIVPDYKRAVDDKPEPAAKSCRPTAAYLTKGMPICAAVAAAQAALSFRLKENGELSALAVDGEFGDDTARAVARFKAENGMDPTCTDIGRKTWTKLLGGQT